MTSRAEGIRSVVAYLYELAESIEAGVRIDTGQLRAVAGTLRLNADAGLYDDLDRPEVEG
ncbi:hypothetical protein [Streptomyces sp. NRRL S-350]|uniref:hypothetical protein n=1 Tax=Streptomyces sp. NRRL S-350 TaxID=1463902 RepID=UPI0004BEAFB4|nr:hypothetical protein [Streptomyces sp. NRRL S-350]